MQWPEAQFKLSVERFFHIQNRNTVRVCTRVVFVFDQFLDFVEAVDRGMRVELTADDDVLTVRRNVDAVRRLRLRDQEKRVVFNGNVHRNDFVVIDDFDVFLVLGELSQLLPVIDMQEVRIVTAHTRFIRRHAYFDTAGIHFGVERVGERPAVTHTLTGIAEVLHIWRHFDSKRLFFVKTAFLFVEFPHGDTAAVRLFVLFDRVVVIVERRRVLAGFDDIVGIRCNECPAVLGFEHRVDDDLLRFEVM